MSITERSSEDYENARGVREKRRRRSNPMLKAIAFFGGGAGETEAVEGAEAAVAVARRRSRRKNYKCFHGATWLPPGVTAPGIPSFKFIRARHASTSDEWTTLRTVCFCFVFLGERKGQSKGGSRDDERI
jgi:hypothetical protein